MSAAAQAMALLIQLHICMPVDFYSPDGGAHIQVISCLRVIPSEPEREDIPGSEPALPKAKRTPTSFEG